MKFLIVTGMSGAGKTAVIHYLEDMGYYCIDNMPPIFLTSFAQVCYSKKKFDNIAVVMDIRGGDMFKDIEGELDRLHDEGFNYKILYLEASDDVLVKRYKESRRDHPLAKGERIVEGIAREKKLLKPLRDRADFIIDTSNMLLKNLKEILQKEYGEDDADYFTVNIISFGYKYGIPEDADLVFDVRFLPNPYYIDRLRPHSGLDEDVSSFVMGYDQSKEFLSKIDDLITTFIPHYVSEGKRQLVVGIGCTGGRHRSVAIAVELSKRLTKAGFKTGIRHRDIDQNKE